MIFCLFLMIVILLLIGFRVRNDNETFLSQELKLSLTGGAVVYIILSHYCLVLKFLKYTGWSQIDGWFLLAISYIRQLCVVPFLMFSGYGFVKSISRKGLDYVCDMPMRRIFPFYLNAQVVYFVMVVLLLLSGGQVTLSLVGKCLIFGRPFFMGAGWYNFCIVFFWCSSVLLYLSLYKCGKLQFYWLGAICTGWIYIVVISHFRGGVTYCYDTALVFPFGSIVGLYEDAVKRVVDKFGIFLLPFIFGLFLLCVFLRLPGCWFNLTSIMFVLTVICFAWFFTIKSSILEWFGRHVMAIYMYHFVFLSAIVWFWERGGGWCYATSSLRSGVDSYVYDGESV